MTNEELMPKYADGERSCPICSEPLPAHQTWPGARYRFCSNPACAVKVKLLPKGRYIEANTVKCEAQGCDAYLPEGRYGGRSTFTACSAECYRRRALMGSILMTCDCGCATKFLRPSERDRITGLVFLSNEHRGKYVREMYANDSFGVFLDIVDRFFAENVPLRYTNDKWIRHSLGPFFRFLLTHGITSLESITPQTITQYLLWAKQMDIRNAAHDLSGVSSFFNWCIHGGYRAGGNPVIPKYHYPPKKQKMPRPISKEELTLAWNILHQRGNARLRFAMAAGEESGIRIGEMCNLRMEDVDLDGQRFFIRLPNKTNTERWALFSEKTKKYYVEWMAERQMDCDHNHVLHNTLGGPSTPYSLREEFKRVLCKTYDGKSNYETGLETWSTHRLRHTMASSLVSAGADAATIMATGGWKSFEAMSWYAKSDDEVARRGYQEAMRHIQEEKYSAPQVKTLTPAELLMRRQITTPASIASIRQ